MPTPSSPTRIRTSRRRDPLSPTASHLVEIASNVPDSKVLVASVQWAFAAGAVKPEQSLEVFHSILSTRAHRMGGPSADRIIQALGLTRSSAFSTPDASGTTGADLVLDALHSSRPGAERMIGWLELMTPEDWLGWPGERSDPTKSPGVAIYEMAAHTHAGPDISALSWLFTHGLDPDLRYRSGRPLAASISNPFDLGAFMQAGGNLRAIVKVDDHDKASSVRLWEYLRKDQDMIQAIDQWCAVHEPAAIAAKQAHEYWARLDGYATSDEIAARAKSHPQWGSLVDEQGRNCAVYLMRMHTSCHRFLSTRQCQGLLSARDHQGRDLWFHALSISDERKAPAPQMLSLLVANAPKGPNPSNGRGLLADLLLDENFNPGLFSSLQYVVEHSKSMKSLSANKWLAGTDDDLGHVARMITGSALGEEGHQISKANLFAICKVLLGHVDHIQHRELCWASLVAIAESNMLKDLDDSKVAGLVARSGKTQCRPVEEEVFKKYAGHLVPAIQAGLSANLMSQDTAASPGGFGDRSPRL